MSTGKCSLQVSRMIAEVYRRPELWNRQHPQHHNRSVLDRQWDSVAGTLGITGKRPRTPETKTARTVFFGVSHPTVLRDRTYAVTICLYMRIYIYTHIRRTARVPIVVHARARALSVAALSLSCPRFIDNYLRASSRRPRGPATSTDSPASYVCMRRSVGRTVPSIRPARCDVSNGLSNQTPLVAACRRREAAFTRGGSARDRDCEHHVVPRVHPPVVTTPSARGAHANVLTPTRASYESPKTRTFSIISRPLHPSDAIPPTPE